MLLITAGKAATAHVAPRSYRFRFGNIGGSLSPLVVGYSLKWLDSWSIPLLIAAGVAILGGVFTLLIDTRKQLPYQT